MVYALNIVDGPSSPDVMFVENTQLGLQEDEDSIGKQWRNELTDREFATLAHQASSDKYGGARGAPAPLRDQCEEALRPRYFALCLFPKQRRGSHDLLKGSEVEF